MSHSRKRASPNHQRETQIEEVGDGGKGKKKKKQDGQQQNKAQHDSSNAKPKVGVAQFLGRVTHASSKK